MSVWEVLVWWLSDLVSDSLLLHRSAEPPVSVTMGTWCQCGRLWWRSWRRAAACLLTLDPIRKTALSNLWSYSISTLCACTKVSELAVHCFSAFWLRSKCSICSYQLNIFFGEDIKIESQYLTYISKKMKVVRPVPDFLPQPLQRRILPSAAQAYIVFIFLKVLFFSIFWRIWLCWSLLSCLYRPFMIFERCLDSHPASLPWEADATNLVTQPSFYSPAHSSSS